MKGNDPLTASVVALANLDVSIQWQELKLTHGYLLTALRALEAELHREAEAALDRAHMLGRDTPQYEVEMLAVVIHQQCADRIAALRKKYE